MLRSQDDLLDFCAYHNVAVDFDELSNCEGRISSHNGKAIVTIKPNQKYESRQRFSIAHELGHFFLHKNPAFYCDLKDLAFWKEGDAEKSREFEANQFASELLMPSKLVSDFTSKERVTFTLASAVAEEFNTSLISSIIKSVEICRFATAVAFYKPGFSLYSYVSKPMYELFLRPKTGRLDSSTLAAKTSRWVQYPKQTNIFGDSWFEDSYKLRPYIVTEEANFFENIGLGISILTLNLK